MSQGRQPEESQEKSSQPRLVAERARATASWGSGWFHREAVTSQTYSPVTNTVQTYIYIRSRFLHLGWQKIQVILCQMNNFVEGQIQNILSVPLLPTSLASLFASLFIWSSGPWREDSSNTFFLQSLDFKQFLFSDSGWKMEWQNELSDDNWSRSGGTTNDWWAIFQTAYFSYSGWNMHIFCRLEYASILSSGIYWFSDNNDHHHQCCLLHTANCNIFSYQLKEIVIWKNSKVLGIWPHLLFNIPMPKWTDISN